MATSEVVLEKALEFLLVQWPLTSTLNDGEVRSACIPLPLQLHLDCLRLDLGRSAFLDAPFFKMILVGSRSVKVSTGR